MLRRKSELCVGCPLYGSGMGYVADKIVPGAKATICLSKPSMEEVDRGAAGYGGEWREVVDSFLPYLGLTENEVSITHAVRCIKERQTRVGEWVRACYEEGEDNPILMRAALHCCRHDQDTGGQLVIAMGNAAFHKYSITNPEVRSQHEWRGHLLP